MSQQLHTVASFAAVIVLANLLVVGQTITSAFSQSSLLEAFDDNAFTLEDIPVQIDVLGNDIGSGGSLTVASVTEPANGVAVDNGDGSITYTPNQDYFGQDTFDYSVTDGVQESAATVTIAIIGVNDYPSVNDDSDSTQHDTPVTTNVITNDFDVDGDRMRVTEVSTPPNNGTAINNLDGTITYIPDAGFFGIDSYIYSLSDGSLIDTATVAIEVQAANHAPIAVDISEPVDQGFTLSITLVAIDDEGDALQYSIINNPSFGTLSGTAPEINYTPNANYSGPDSFTYKANDGTLDSNIATVSITVNPLSDTPIAFSQSVMTNEDTPVEIILTASDQFGQDLIWIVTSGPVNGVLVGTLPNATYIPNDDFNGTDSFTFKVNDGTADSNVATVSITVSDVPETTFPIVHMSSDTRTFGLSTFSARQAHVEFVNSTSELVGDSIDQVTLKLRKTGAPTGTFEVGIFNEDLSVKKLFNAMDASNLTQSYTDYTFSLTGDELYTIEEGDRIGIKFNGGNSSNFVAIMTDQDPTDPFDADNTYRMYYTTNWMRFTASDLYMILTQTHD
jgi:hypothetical protein